MSTPPIDLAKHPRLLDWLRYFCAFMLYMYGSSKLLHFQFNLQSELAHRPIGSLTGYDYGPYVISTLICISLIAILWHQRIALFMLLWSTQSGEPEMSKRVHWWIRSSLVMVVAAMLIFGAVMQRRQHSRQQTQTVSMREK